MIHVVLHFVCGFTALRRRALRPQLKVDQATDMRAVRCSFRLLVGALPMVSALQAQHRPVSLAAGAGLLFADHGASTILRSKGIAAYLRVDLPHVPLLLDASIVTVLRNNDIVFGPCPPAPAACSSTFVGPTTALTVSPSIQATERVPGAAWLFRFGPSVSWLPDRAPGSDPLAPGLRVGISVRHGHGVSGLLMSVDYFRLFRAGTPPTWFIPVTIGWQF